jgi:hypothetical protein
MSKPQKIAEPAEALISVRPKKNSALSLLANQARARGDRGAMSDMVHGWAERHLREGEDPAKAATPPPEVDAFD